jgi:hypothetical protein
MRPEIADVHEPVVIGGTEVGQRRLVYESIARLFQSVDWRRRSVISFCFGGGFIDKALNLRDGVAEGFQVGEPGRRPIVAQQRW